MKKDLTTLLRAGGATPSAAPAVDRKALRDRLIAVAANAATDLEMGDSVTLVEGYVHPYLRNAYGVVFAPQGDGFDVLWADEATGALLGVICVHGLLLRRVA